jgi:CheY-like chemotaxis protein
MAQVLIIDPDAGTREVLRDLLEDEGHTVVAATGDYRAVEDQLRHARIRLVVLFDYTRMYRAGPTLVHALGVDPDLARQHVYILTTADMHPFPREVTDYLARFSLPVMEKPFELSCLLALMAEAARVLVAMR